MYTCKDGYATAVLWLPLVPGCLLLDQLGFTDGAGSWLGLVLLFGSQDTVNPGFSFCSILSLFLVKIKVVISVGSREVLLPLPFNWDLFNLDFSYFIIEELAFSEVLKKAGGFCRVEGNPALSGASSVNFDSGIKVCL